MSPERCAELTLQAAAARRRQMIMTAEGKLLVWLYQFVPELLESQLARLGSLYDEA
jgi:hypothetical protein